MRVTTKDFQILQGTNTFEFPVGITVIQGKTGSGKTTLFYAIEDCLINPSGVDDAIHWDAKCCNVTIENNGSKIKWTKTPTSSEYTDELTGKHFVKASKLDSTDLGDLGFYIKDGDVVNIQDEWKLLFPFGLKDTDMFRLFEDIFNISCSFMIIDDYKKEEQGIKSSIDQTTKQINAITQDLTNITDILNKFNEQELTNLIDTINTKQQVVSQLQESFNNLSKMIKYTQIKVPQLYDTTDLVKQSTYYTQLKEDYNKYLVNQSKVNINLPDEKTFDLKENPYIQDYNSYKQLLRDIQDYETSLNNYDAQISNLEKEKAKIKVCPTCGRPLED